MSIGSANIYDLLSGHEDDDVKAVQAPKKVATTPAQKVAPKPKEATKKLPQVGANIADAPVKENRPRKDNKTTGGPGSRNILPKKAKEVQAPGAKRLFDRHSGTGRGKTENKKSGAGKGNWGTNEDQGLEEKQQEPTSDIKEEAVKVEEDKEQPQAESEAPPKEEDKTMTLAEFKKAAKKNKPSTVTKVRLPGEGVDQKWNDTVELKRDENDTVIVGPKKPAKTTEPKKEDQSPKEKGGKKEGAPASSESRVRLDEVFNIREGAKEFRPRGGRGGDRRRGSGSFSGRGGKRGGSSKPFNLNEEAFPSLTTKA